MKLIWWNHSVQFLPFIHIWPVVCACMPFLSSYVCMRVTERGGFTMTYSYTRCEFHQKTFLAYFSFSLAFSVEDLMLRAEMDLQLVENSVIAVENILKAWLHDQTGEREHLQLLLSAPAQTNPSTNKPTPTRRPDPGDSHHTYTVH